MAVEVIQYRDSEIKTAYHSDSNVRAYVLSFREILTATGVSKVDDIRPWF